MIGPCLRQQTFVGGPLGTNNPTRELLNEATSLFGKDQRVAQILSIGSGLPRVMAMSSVDPTEIHRLLNDIAADCETVAQELSTRLFNVDSYLRLNVDRGMEDLKMEDWNELGTIESHTGAYITKAVVAEVIDTSLQHLVDRIGTVTLGQLSMYFHLVYNTILADRLEPQTTLAT